MTDCLTGFTDFTFTNESNGFNAEDMAELVLQNFFVQRGMPRMVVVEADGLLAGVFRAMCEALLIPCEAVSRENQRPTLASDSTGSSTRSNELKLPTPVRNSVGSKLSHLPVMPGTLPQLMERTFPDALSPLEEILQRRARSAQARHSKPLSFSTRASHFCKNNGNFSTS